MEDALRCVVCSLCNDRFHSWNISEEWWWFEKNAIYVRALKMRFQHHRIPYLYRTYICMYTYWSGIAPSVHLIEVSPCPLPLLLLKSQCENFLGETAVILSTGNWNWWKPIRFLHFISHTCTRTGIYAWLQRVWHRNRRRVTRFCFEQIICAFW